MLAVFVSIALMTGARRSSIAAMRWADLDLRAGKAVWIVPARWSKNGVELAIAVTDEAAAVLAVWRERCPASAWVFPSPEAGVRPSRRTAQGLGADQKGRWHC